MRHALLIARLLVMFPLSSRETLLLSQRYYLSTDAIFGMIPVVTLFAKSEEAVDNSAIEILIKFLEAMP